MPVSGSFRKGRAARAPEANETRREARIARVSRGSSSRAKMSDDQRGKFEGSGGKQMDGSGFKKKKKKKRQGERGMLLPILAKEDEMNEGVGD